MTKNGIDRDSWSLISELFDEAVQKPVSEREDYVRERCSERPELLAELTTLLRAHDSAGDFLDGIDPDGALDLLDDDIPQPNEVGPFRIIRELGRGGMGVVYLCDRSDGEFDRMVAVKVIKRGMDTDAIRRRFLRERQILANLEHPHIGRLYDGGVTETGQPYFAMEYVDGLPITQYCDERRLPIRERLELFGQVCRAVQYAHENLVIHRDLKPSNMLVTSDGRLKLVDFGIAKVIGDGPGIGSLMLTDGGQRVLTPAYASPEQLEGSAISTASDVYSLGVVLYELLSGRRPGPYDPAKTPSKVVAPSAVLSDDSREVVDRRQTTTGRLRRYLRGDLDTIVLKSLRHEPARRYTSAEGLAEDLRRHGKGLPIKARPESRSYRLRKFVDRHRIGVSASVLIGILLLGALGVSLNLARERSREAAKAQQVTAFMASLFASSDPDRAQGAEITAAELLEQGARRIETELAGQPDVQSDLLEVMGGVYLKLGLYVESEKLNRSALELRRSMYGERHPLVASSLHGTGYALRGQARWEEAVVFLEEALEQQREFHGEVSNEVGLTLYDLASIQAHRNGNYEEAERLNRQAVAIFEETAGYESEPVARGLYNMGVILNRTGHYEDAVAQFEKSLALWKRLVGDQHRSVAKNTSGLATANASLGRLDEAERLYREALAIRQHVQAPDHPDMATSLNNLAGVLRQKGNFDEAAGYLEEACTIYKNRLGVDHPYALICRQNLGAALVGAGLVVEGLEMLEEALQGRIEVLGPDNPEVAGAYTRIGDALNLIGRYDEAEPYLRHAVEIREAAFGADNAETAAAVVRLAVALRNKGEADEARDLLERAYRTQVAEFGAHQPTTMETRALLDSLP